MKFVFSIPVLLTVLTGSNSAIASHVESEHQTNLPTEIALEEPSDPAQSTADFASFIRTFRNLLVTDVRTFESDLSLTAGGSGFTFAVEAQVQTIVEQPNRFQSRIQFKNIDGTTGSQYVVTSNGQQVWVYDSSQNIYSVMSYDKFNDDYNDSFLIGMFTIFLLGVLEDTEGVEDFLSIPEAELLQDEAMVRELADILEIEGAVIGTEVVNGTTYTTFVYVDEQDGFTMTLLIDPTTSLIEGVNLVSDEEGFNMLMEEEISHTDLPEATAPTSFTFIPPEEAQRSEAPISIAPF